MSLINREDLVSFLKERYKIYTWDDGGKEKAECGAIIREINKFPSAEKKGRNISQTGFLCSECSFGDFDGFHGYEPNYCPNCGAKMEVAND